MEIYLVGGAVRDELLGLPIRERDWVVVGATPEELIAMGFIPVGKEFPVFLHPQTHEEYALARTERKVGKGYKGFTFYTSPEVRLEDDLIRRDITINAMAKSKEGQLFDPFGGQKDLQHKLLRHVSPAFIEDPVRILRVARFAAKFGEFQVAAETNQLMQQMVENGEVNALVPERVWQEFSRALAEKNPEKFFSVLENCQALGVLFPQIQLEGLGLKSLQETVKLFLSSPIRFAVLLHELTQEQLKKFCKDYRVPNEFSDLAYLLAKAFPIYEKILSTDASTLLSLLKTLDAIRRPERFEQFILGSRAILTAKNSSQISEREDLLKNALEAIKKIDITDLLKQNYPGKDLADKITQRQLEALSKMNF